MKKLLLSLILINGISLYAMEQTPAQNLVLQDYLQMVEKAFGEDKKLLIDPNLSYTSKKETLKEIALSHTSIVEDTILGRIQKIVGPRYSTLEEFAIGNDKGTQDLILEICSLEYAKISAIVVRRLALQSYCSTLVEIVEQNNFHDLKVSFEKDKLIFQDICTMIHDAHTSIAQDNASLQWLNNLELDIVDSTFNQNKLIIKRIINSCAFYIFSSFTKIIEKIDELGQKRLVIKCYQKYYERYILLALQGHLITLEDLQWPYHEDK